MPSSTTRVAYALGAASLITFMAPSDAAADDVDRCVAASERGQAARRKKQYGDARAAFIECSADKCPAIVRQACGEWLDQVDQSLPSIVVAIVSPDGRDIAGAKVTIDDQPHADATAARLDPGAHTIRAQAEGYESESLQIVAREGDRNRAVRLTLKPIAQPAHDDDRTKTSSSEGARAHEDVRSPGGIPTLALVTGGAAVLTLGSFVFFAVTGRSRAQDLRATCAPTCPEADRDAVQTRYIIADVSLVATVILGGISVWSILSSKPDAPAGASPPRGSGHAAAGQSWLFNAR